MVLGKRSGAIIMHSLSSPASGGQRAAPNGVLEPRVATSCHKMASRPLSRPILSYFSYLIQVKMYKE